MITPKFTLIFLALFGAIFIGTIVHESVHLVQANEVYSMCYDLGQKSFMHVEGDYENKNISNLEMPAYIVQALITVTLIICLIIDFKLKQKTL